MQLEVDSHKAYVYTGAREFAPNQPSVVFIHGAGLDHTVWILQSRWFAHHGYNVLAVDMPGHGRSHGEALHSIEDMATWIWKLVDAMGISHAHLVGHSMGALTALEASASAPHRALSTALLGVSVPMPVSDALLSAARDDLSSAIDMITIWGHGFDAQLGGNPAPGMWMMGSARNLLARSFSGVLHNDLRACNDYQQGFARAVLISNPSLVLLGAQDVMASPRGATAFLQALPNVDCQILQSCGHMMMAEQPDQVLDALIQCIEQTAGQTASQSH